MYNVASAKSQNSSPKTPGGISKSLLTPCRRVGLSRKWKKSGVSPFISPLTSNNKVEDQNGDTVKENTKICDKKETDVIPQRKRSRTLLAALNESNDKDTTEPTPDLEKEQQINVILTPKDQTQPEISEVTQIEVSTPVTHLAKGKRKSFKKTSPKVLLDNNTDPPKLQKLSKTKSINKNKKDFKVVESSDIELKSNIVEIIQDNNENHANDSHQTAKYSSPIKHEIPKIKSPNDLSKECIVVIQNNLFKNPPKIDNENAKCKNDNKTSQMMFDSDDEPLINIDKEKSSKDDDFVEKKPKVRKLNDKIKDTATNSQKTTNKSKNTKSLNIDLSDDDEDFELSTKKTILIRKNYEKVTKPTKAKSTGSITQKDIDELKQRIESKKKQLLARSMTDTKELRELIKKWQKGCQEALLELMDLIKAKCPDKSNMDYSEILKTLKIPPNLVGYDGENDCFVTPDDESVIMASISE